MSSMRDEPLAAGGPGHRQAALGLPAAERLDGDAEHLGGLADPQERLRLQLILLRPYLYILVD